MKRRAISDSSNIASVGYNAFDKVMEVEFQGGRVYTYDGITLDLYEDFMEAPSKGTYFANYIRPSFTGTQVENPDPQEEPEEEAKPEPLEVLEVVGDFSEAIEIIDGLKGPALAAHLVEKHDFDPQKLNGMTDDELLSWHAKDHTAMSHD